MSGLARMAVALCVCLCCLISSVVGAEALPEEAVAGQSDGEVYSPATVIDNARHLTDVTIKLKGEVIGPVLWRGDSAWLNLGMDGVAVGVWVDAAQARDLSTGGAYGIRGDIVLVTGEVRATCEQHGGELDVHAISVFVLTSGGPLDGAERFDSWPTAIGMSIAGLISVALVRLRLRSLAPGDNLRQQRVPK